MANQKGLDFKHKEVINIADGKRLGYVQDVTADLESRYDYIYYSATVQVNLLTYFNQLRILLFLGTKYIVSARILY